MKNILLMNRLDAALAAIQPVLDQVSQRWGYRAFQSGLLQNVEFCDQLLQMLHAHQGISEEVRTELYGSYIGPGPGGMQAFYWLLQHDHLDRSLIRDYLFCLQTGPARSGALSEEEFMPLLHWLLEDWRGECEELVLDCLCRLLNSHAISARARCAGLRVALGDEGLPPEWRTRVAHWACRSNLNDPDLPIANEELHRAGLMECVRLGEPPEQVLDLAVAQLSGEEDELVGSTVLELLQKFPREIRSERQLEVLLQLRDSQRSGLRRRAFQLLEESQGEEWIHQGLRDRDSAVRSWAMQRAQQKKAQTA